MTVEATDFVTDECYADGWRHLLNDEGDALAADLPIGWNALAELALTTHRQAPRLAFGRIEQVIGWLKREKACRGRTFDDLRPSSTPFAERLQALRVSALQVALQQDAVKAIRWETLYAGLLLAAVAISALSWRSDWHWYVYLVPAFFIWWFAGAWNAQKMVVAMRWKAQDREYFLDCLRASRTIRDLSESGLFLHPDTLLVAGKPWNEHESHARMLALRDQLTDALYRDPEGFLPPLKSSQESS